VPEGYVLCKLYIPNDDFSVCLKGRGMRVSDSARAILASADDIVVDATLYPGAALVQAKAMELLVSMDVEELGAYDRVALAYGRISNEGRMAIKLDEGDSLPKAELTYVAGTAYGLFAGYGGDSFGYADAFYTLCNMAGVPCIKLTCTRVGEEEAFCINAAFIDGEWYILDVYAAFSVFNSDANLFERFCLSAAQAAQFYDWNAPGLVISDSTELNKSLTVLDIPPESN